MEAWDSDESMEIYRGQIDHHREEFLNQFRLSQESLTALYAEDLTELKEGLTILMSQVQDIREVLAEKEWEKELEGLSLTPEKKEQLKHVLEWSKAGYTNEEIARQLQVGVGEVLLLKQLKK